jgi:hypothetical protein
MKRIMLSVTEQQGEWLKATARQHGLGVAELLRRIIDSWREDGGCTPLRTFADFYKARGDRAESSLGRKIERKARNGGRGEGAKATAATRSAHERLQERIRSAPPGAAVSEMFAFMQELWTEINNDPDAKPMSSNGFSLADLIRWAGHRDLQKLRSGDDKLLVTINGMTGDLVAYVLRLVDIGMLDMEKQSIVYLTFNDIGDDRASNFLFTARKEAMFIGCELNESRGFTLMQAVCGAVSRYMGSDAAGELDAAWNGIGDWCW